MSDPGPVPLLEYPSWHDEGGAPTPATPAWGTGGAGTAGSSTNPLTTDQATTLFDNMKALTHVPFDFPDDGCYARAHEMYRKMQEQGIESGKAWNYGRDFESGSPTLTVTTSHHPDGSVSWRYHVAPVVWVQGADGSPTRMVIDPSVHDGPVSPEDWKKAQSDTESRLEFSDGKPFYKTPDALPDGTPTTPAVQYDNDYKKTEETLKEKSEERDERKANHPELFPDSSGSSDAGSSH